MKNLKKTGKRFFAMFLSLVMALGIMQVTALAGTFDSVTVHFRVFDESTGQVYELDKTDTAYASQTTSWQSAPYQVPNLSTLIPSGASFGRVTKATATNVQTYESFNQGTTIYFSTNANSGTITYWVNWYKSGSGSGTGSNQNENVNIGTGGRYSWTQYIRYHSNYPDGTDYTYTVAYNIQSYSNMYNTFGQVIKTLAGVGFSVPSGYSAKTPIWNTAKNGSGTGYAPNSNYVFYQSQANKTLDLYAQYEAEGGTPATPVTLTYMDGDTVYRTISGFLAGDPVTVIDCTTEKEGYTFKGWDTSANATNVVYAAGAVFQIMGNTTLYAVWEEDTPVPTTTTLKLLKGIDGITQAQLPDDFALTAVVRNVTTKQQQTYTIDKNTVGLNLEIDISLSDTYSVTMSEANYDVNGYTCEATGGEDAIDIGGTYIYTIAPNTVNPICTINNNYTSNAPVEPTKPETTKTVQRWDNGWVDVEVDPDTNETEEIDPGTRLKYTVRVTNPGSVPYENLRVSDVMSFELALDQDSCQGVLKTTDGSVISLDKPSISVIPNRSTTQTWNIARDIPAGAVVEITYEAVVGEYQVTSMDNRVSAAPNALQTTRYATNDIADNDLTSAAIVKVITKAPTENVANPSNSTMVEDTSDADSGLGA